MDLDLEKKGNMSKKLVGLSGVSQKWKVRLHFLELGKQLQLGLCAEPAQRKFLLYSERVAKD